MCPSCHAKCFYEVLVLFNVVERFHKDMSYMLLLYYYILHVTVILL